jgi:hypothetical protein
MKRLRERVTRNVITKEERQRLYIPYMVTGEYGDKRKRPHWHAILFNYYPSDAKYKYTTDHGERVFDSDEVQSIWGKGIAEFGSVTMESAGYVARYAAKKLVHGKDQEHNYHPIHRTSCKRAIGRTWIEKNWRHTFENGYILTKEGIKLSIPRYYTDWFKENKPLEYTKYECFLKQDIIKKAELKARKEEIEYFSNVFSRGPFKEHPLSPSKLKETVLKSKFKQLQERLKL